MKTLPQPSAFAIASFFILAPAVTVGGGLALPVMLCLAGAACLRPSLFRQVLEKRPLSLWLVLALTTWSMLSTAWSPLPMDDQVWKLAALVPLGLLFVAGVAANARTRQLALAGAIAGCLVLIPMLGIEAALDMPMNQAARPGEPVDQIYRLGGHGVTILLAFAWPAVGALLRGGWPGRLTALAILAGCAWLSVQFDQLSNAAAFAVGMLGFVAAFVLPRLAIIAATTGLAAWQLAAPFAIPLLFSDPRLIESLPLSWAARTGIWNYVSARVLEEPLLGHGLEASRAVTDRIDVRDMSIMAVPIHPHSASLQFWYETGAVGAVLAVLLLLVGGWRLAGVFARDRGGAAAACATIASLGLIANVSYGIWAEWWMATLFIAAALVGALTAQRSGA